jgi:hypothetical protein
VSAVIAPVQAALAFPSRAWFARLAELMNLDRARQEQLGYVDCVAQFTVLDGGPAGTPVSFQVTFEEFSAIAVTEHPGRELAGADFALQARLADWRAMIESIAAGGGRPALDQTLNRLSHMGTPFELVADDPLHADYYFRYNQSLQEFVNASARFSTRFDPA